MALNYEVFSHFRWRSRHVCKCWRMCFSPLGSDHSPSTGGGGGRAIYSPLKSKDSPWARDRAGDREVWAGNQLGGGWRVQAVSARFKGLQFHSQAPRSYSLRLSSVYINPTSKPQIPKSTHHFTSSLVFLKTKQKSCVLFPEFFCEPPLT